MKEENSIENKLSTLKYYCDNESHLVLDKELCRNCKEKACLYVCPARVYEIDNETKEINVQYENCLECGACRMACPKNAIDWNYPKASLGVLYKKS